MSQQPKTKVEYYFDGQTASDGQSSDTGSIVNKMSVAVTGLIKKGEVFAYEPSLLHSNTSYKKMSASEPSSDTDDRDNKIWRHQKDITDEENKIQRGQYNKLNNKSVNSEDKKWKDPARQQKLEFTTISNQAQARNYPEANTEDSQNPAAELNTSQLTLQAANSRILANKGTMWRMCGIFILCGAIIGGSSIGTIANFIPIQTSFAKNSWRSGILVFLFIIPTIVEWRIKRHEVDYRGLISLYQYGFLMLTLFFQVLWTAGLIYASLNTIQSQAYVFNNVHGLYIVLISLFLGVVPSRKEWIGLCLAILGCVCIIMDPEAVRVASGPNQDGGVQSFWPGIIDLASAFFGALYFLMSARNVKNLPVCLLILIMNMHTWMLNGLVAKYQNPEIALFSFEPETGCLGFLNLMGNPLLPLFSYAIFASFFGSAGYILCLLFYSPLVTSNAYLLEPFFAQLLGFGLGLDKLPGIATAIGTLFAVLGIGFIDAGSRDRQQNQQIVQEKEDQQDGGNGPLGDITATLNQSGMISLSGLNHSHYSMR